mmetsp:Transcript_52051/g.111413  ORF Transcript_52051/g.111413 Transcript_52051/m.111413 type:complete len:458 (-) Transcript_52051:151-1524(-)
MVNSASGAALLAALAIHVHACLGAPIGAAASVTSCEAETDRVADLGNVLLLQTDHHLGAQAAAAAAAASYLPEELRQPQMNSAGAATTAAPQPKVPAAVPTRTRTPAGLEVEAVKVSPSGSVSAPVRSSISGSLPLATLVETGSAENTHVAQVWIWVVVLLILALCLVGFVDFGRSWNAIFRSDDDKTQPRKSTDSVRKSRGGQATPSSPAGTLLSQPGHDRLHDNGDVEVVDERKQGRDSDIIKRRSENPRPSLTSSNTMPPLLCPSLILPNTEARFMVDMDTLKSGVQSGNLCITGTSGRKLLHGTLCEMGSTRVFKLCSVDCEEDPRATVHTDASGIMKIFGRGGEFYGDLEPNGNTGVVLVCDGRPAMTVEFRDPIDLQMTACTMDGRQLAQAGRAQLPARRQACLAEGSSGVVWKLQVKPGADAVLLASTMLSMLLLRSNKIGEIWQPTASQ